MHSITSSTTVPQGADTPLSEARSLLAQLVPHTWEDAINPMLTAHLYGTPAGRKTMQAHLAHMARFADLAYAAVALLNRRREIGAEQWERQAGELVVLAKVLADNAPSSDLDDAHLAASTPASPAPASIDGHTVKDVPQYGRLARQLTHEAFELEVCYCAAGFYLGTVRDNQPFTRESVEYWPRRELASTALATGRWKQRAQP